jgi:hypothetical protein
MFYSQSLYYSPQPPWVRPRGAGVNVARPHLWVGASEIGNKPRIYIWQESLDLLRFKSMNIIYHQWNTKLENNLINWFVAFLCNT